MESQKPSKLTRTPSSLRPSSAHSSSHEEIPDMKKTRRPYHPPAHPRILRILATLSLLSALIGIILLSVYFAPSLAGLIAVWLTLAVLYLLFKKIRSSLIKPKLKPTAVQWYIGDDYNKNSKVSRSEPCLKSNLVSEGIKYYDTGDSYEGEFYKGRSNGSGVYNFFGEGKYEGDWVDDKYNGYGIENWAKGSRYIGQYRDGVKHGLGVHRFFNGYTYSGEWVSGQSNGRGIQSCADGSHYVGEFKAGAKHGLGCYYYR